MHDSTTQTALLIETAESHRRIAEASLARLEAQSRGLDTIVRTAIRQALTEELQAVRAETQRVEAALRAARWAANREIALHGALLALFLIAMAFAWSEFG